MHPTPTPTPPDEYQHVEQQADERTEQIVRGAAGQPGHTDRDLAELILAGIDPTTRQANELPKPCGLCGTRQTRNRNNVCDRCQPHPAR